MTGDATADVLVVGAGLASNLVNRIDPRYISGVGTLIAAGARVQAFDPEGMHEAAKLLDGVEMKDSAYDAVQGADAVVIVTEWDQFRALDLDRVKLLMNQPVLVDLRNIYRPEDMQRRGFRYSGIGRG